MTKLILTILFFGIGISIFSQLTPSERRRQQDEQNNSNGDTEKAISPSEKRKLDAENKIQNDIWTNEKEFKTIDHPVKWNNESAIVLNQEMKFTYLRGKKNIILAEEVVRKRIKLLDKAAVEKFSTFFYMNYEAPNFTGYGYNTINQTKVVAGFRLIKPDGKEITVDLNGEDAVKYGDVPFLFRSIYFGSYFNYKKVAIPNLEVGDIIDYFHFSVKPISTVAQKEIDYLPFIFTLAGEYPISYQSYEFITDRGFYLNCNSYNGAPILRSEEMEKLDSKGKPIKSSLKKHVLLDENRDKKKVNIFNYPLITSPTVKFQVYFISPKGVQNTTNFVGDMNVPKSTPPTNLEIQQVVSRSISSDITSKAYSDPIIKKLKQDFKSSTNEEKIRYAYYRLRNDYITHFIGEEDERTNISSENFSKIMSSVLSGLNINYDVVVAVPKQLGNLDNLLLSYEIDIFLKAYDESGSPIFLFPFSSFSDFNMTNYNYSGVEAIEFKKNEKPVSDNTKRITIPKVTSKKNTSSQVYNIKISEDFEFVNIEKRSDYYGIFKLIESNLRLHHHDYKEVQLKKYDPEFSSAPTTRNVTVLNEALEKKNEKINAQKTERLKTFKLWLEEDDYNVREYKNFEILSLGIDEPGTPLKLIEEYELNEIVTKAGNNYFIQIGKVWGDQLQLKEKQLEERKVDVFINYPKSYLRTININIPEGYSIGNLDDFNRSIDNNAGKFTCSATVTDNIVTVNFEKVYKTDFLDKSEWSKLVKVLETAYSFSQKKLILKKD